MPIKFRLGTFNVENLFSRAKVFTFKNPSTGDKKMEIVGELQAELEKPVYEKQKIIELYKQVKDYVTIREDRAKFWKGNGYTDIQANGVDDWDGSLVYKQALFSDLTRENTARVIKDINADILCLVEVEDKPALATFNSQLLNSKYEFNMLIDAFDPRGIDVALYSKFALGDIRTHMYDKGTGGRIFSRDCLEVEVMLTEQLKLHVLCNHLKSRGYGTTQANDAKRKLQAQKIAKILTANYQLDRDLVAVCGDFNDTPDSNALEPLLNLSGLKDVQAMQFPNNPEKRWTYHYKTNDQIDFLLVSQPLQSAFVKAGVERRGMFDLLKYSTGQEKSYPTVTSGANAASDHGAVCADFVLNV